MNPPSRSRKRQTDREFEEKDHEFWIAFWGGGLGVWERGVRKEEIRQMKPDSATWIDSPPSYPTKPNPIFILVHASLFTTPLHLKMHIKCTFNSVNRVLLGTTIPRPDTSLFKLRNDWCGGGCRSRFRKEHEERGEGGRGTMEEKLTRRDR